jgi:ribokinase
MDPARIDPARIDPARIDPVRIEPARICVLGSANMDLVVFADRAPARGETVTGERFVTIPGGKGANQAIAAARAGGEVGMVGAVGRDAYGDQVLAVLAAAGVDVGHVARVEATTGTAHILVDGDGDNSIVVVPGANGAVRPPVHGLGAALDRAGSLLLQLELPLDAVTEGARSARARGVKVVLTPAPARQLPDELLAVVDLLVPNEHEAAVLTGERDVDAAAEALLDLVPEVVVTLGARGALWRGWGTKPVRVPAPEVDARDTTAAGDTFVGALAVALGEGREMPEALVWASAAAGLSVQREGASTSMPHRAAIDAAVGAAGEVSR